MFCHNSPTFIEVLALEEENYTPHEVSQSLRDQGTVDFVQGTYDNKGLPFLRKREKGKYRIQNEFDLFDNTVTLPVPIAKVVLQKGKDSNIDAFKGTVSISLEQDEEQNKETSVPKVVFPAKPDIPPDPNFEEYINFFNTVVNEEIDKRGIFPEKFKLNNVSEWVDGTRLVKSQSVPIPSSIDIMRMEPSLLYSFEGRV